MRYQRRRKSRRADVARQKDAFRVGRAWILERLDELVSKGWTRKELLRAGRYSFPHDWGPAWSSNWTREHTEAELGEKGEIIWRWNEGSRFILQVARPKGAGV